MPNVLSSAKSVIQAQPGHELLEKYGPLLRTGIDKAFERTASYPVQGEQYFASSTETKGYRKYQSKVGTGLIKENRDNSELPKIEGGLGFGHEISTIGYRGAMSVERELLEKELYNQVGQEQRDLIDAGKRTIELILADVFNRAFGGLASSADPYSGGAAQFTCEDGAYFISKLRNNPLKIAGTWSNRGGDEAFGAGSDNDGLLAEVIREQRLAFRQYKNDRGVLSPYTMKRVIVSPVLEDTMRRITSTKLVYSGSGKAANAAETKFSDSATNVIAGTAFDVYDWLDDGKVFFEANGENELELLWRVMPTVTTYTDGNPDMIHQRIRMSCGTGCTRPCTWRGVLFTGTSNI